MRCERCLQLVNAASSNIHEDAVFLFDRLFAAQYKGVHDACDKRLLSLYMYAMAHPDASHKRSGSGMYNHSEMKVLFQFACWVRP